MPNDNLLIVFSGLSIVVLGVLIFYVFRIKKIKKKQSELMDELKKMKNTVRKTSITSDEILQTNAVILDKEKIQTFAENRINESDWKILEMLVDNPSISNSALANHVALSVDGTRSSLKKMYRLFEIPSSRNMRLSLALKVTQLSKLIHD